ncbi:MAG TPA: lysophospholipid acyltransferase family protein [Gammaproteobacteria bacterium]
MQFRAWLKKLKYKIAEPLLWAYFNRLRNTVIMEPHGEQVILGLIKRGQPFIPCYWHQQNLPCAFYLLDMKQHGLNAGFLVSPSRDGEAPANIFRRWGAHVVRGSSSRTGAQAMRELYLIITRDKVSPSNTPDGPRGPLFECKPGPLLLAQLTQVPVVPMAAAADRYRQFKSWDRFIMPKWGARLCIQIGEPIYVEKGLSMNDLEPLRLRLQQTLMQLSAAAQQHLQKTA